VGVGQYDGVLLEASFWRAFPRLRELHLGMAAGGIVVEDFDVPSLEELSVSREEKRLSGVPPLAQMSQATWPRLRRLSIEFGTDLNSAEELLWAHRQLGDLLCVGRLPALRSLSLQALHGVGRLVPIVLEEFPALETLEVSEVVDGDVARIASLSGRIAELQRFVASGRDLSDEARAQLVSLRRGEV
jgi:hypothetical protein